MFVLRFSPPFLGGVFDILDTISVLTTCLLNLDGTTPCVYAEVELYFFYMLWIFKYI